MKLTDVKIRLNQITHLSFKLPNSELVPSHFHVTEVGIITKNFIDCGGTLRKEEVVCFQLWSADDFDHALRPQKLLSIIELSERVLNIDQNLEVEVEYQGQSIEKYGLDFFDGSFQLITKQTDCLAKDNCGIPAQKPKIKRSDLAKNVACCSPESNCC